MSRDRGLNLALVTHSLPQPSAGGGQMTSWAVLEEMAVAGHQVTALCLVEPSDPFITDDRLAPLSDLGVRVQTIHVPAYGAPRLPPRTGGRLRYAADLLRPTLESAFPTLALVPRVEALLRAAGAHGAFAYHWEAVAATLGLKDVARVGAVDDPWHLPNFRRWQLASPRLSRSYALWTARTLVERRRYPDLMVELLRDLDVAACFQPEAAEWLRRRGATACEYFPSPVPDAAGPNWRERRRPNAKLRVLLGPSDLGITSTRAGIVLFAREILPRLTRKLGEGAFEVHIVGGGEPPVELARLLPHPTVKLRGRVDPADAEFLSADVQLVATPFVLGMRKRIAVGMSFGCCIVAHESETRNIPELRDGENALIAADGAGLADAIVRAARDPELRERLGANARRTYERTFHPTVAGRRIVEMLETLVGRPSVHDPTEYPTRTMGV